MSTENENSRSLLAHCGDVAGGLISVHRQNSHLGVAVSAAIDAGIIAYGVSTGSPSEAFKALAVRRVISTTLTYTLFSKRTTNGQRD